MAKMVSELGADVFDDTIQEKTTRFTRKQRNYMIGLPIVGVIVILLSIVYVMAANVWLIDLENMPYIRYAINSTPDENGEQTASINRVSNLGNYPTTFRIPGTINGYKITEIDDYAFAGCDRLEKVIIHDNIRSIGVGAFSACENLGEFVFSKNIEHIGEDAFLETEFIKNLPQNDVVLINSVLLHVGEGIFKDVLDDNPSANQIALVTKTGDYTTRFKNYKSLGYELFDMDTLQVIHNVDNPIDNDVEITQWMEGVFKDNEYIGLVEIPRNLTEVPTKAFVNCEEIETIVFHDQITDIGANAFYGCTSLQNLSIPANVKKISDYAFANTGVSISTIPSTIETLGEGVFENCKNIQSFTFPSTISEVPHNLFAGCSSLSTFTFENPDNILSLGNEAFKNTNLSSFTVPDNITIISQGLFENCENLSTVYMLENINQIPVKGSTESEDSEITLQGVSSIYTRAFNGCTKLSSIKLVDNNGDVLAKCNDNKTLYFPSSLKTLAAVGSGDTYKAFSGIAAETLRIGKNVTGIGAEAFLNTKTLKSVIFEDIAQSKLGFLGSKVFAGCTSLTSFVFPDSVYEINTSLFYNCSNLVSVHLPEVNNIIGGNKPASNYTTIKENMFEGCTKLEEINIPSTISKISKKSFSGCTSLTELFIPKKVATIMATSFEGCSNLTLYLERTENEIPKTYEKGWNTQVKTVLYGQTQN
jgi:hypothetical protein